MLDSLRRAAGTWVAKLLLILLVLSFAVWGISGQIVAGLGNAVLTVGDTTVLPQEYRLAYDRQLSVLSQQFGTRITREQAQAIGVDGQVLGQLIAGAALDEQARTLGLGLSKDRLAALTAEDPAFRGPNGQFDRQQFEYVLRQVGMRPEDYIRNRQQVAVRQQIVEAVSDGIAVPDAFLRALALHQGETRTVEYVAVPESSIGEIEEPSDTVLAEWFDKNKADYEAPEYRKIAYVKLEPADIADPAAITDEQVAEDYERNKARFTTAETRRIEQLVFANAEAAAAARQKLAAGMTFDELIVAEGKTAQDVLIGTLAKSRVTDPAIADAAFSLQENAVSDVVDGAFGPVLLRVTEIQPEVVKPLSAVASDIRNEIALSEASDQLLDVHDRYEDARAAGDTLAEAAGKLNLKVVTIDAVDRAGRNPEGTVLENLPESQDLLRGAFETEPGIENPSIHVGSTGFVFYEVEGVTPKRDRPLDEVREKALADWKDEQRELRLTAKAEELEKRVRDGARLDEIAAEVGTEKQIKRGARRGADDPDFGQSGITAIFEVAPNAVGRTAAPSGDAIFVFRVTEAFEPAGAGADSIAPENREAFASGLADDLLEQLVARLRGEYGVQVNEAAIQQALSF